MGVNSLFALLMLAMGHTVVQAYDWKWKTGRATYYGEQHYQRGSSHTRMSSMAVGAAMLTPKLDMVVNACAAQAATRWCRIQLEIAPCAANSVPLHSTAYTEGTEKVCIQHDMVVVHAGTDEWSIHKGSCGYGAIWRDEPHGWDVGTR